MYYIKKPKKKKEKPLPLFDKAGIKIKKEAGFSGQTRQSFQPLYPAS